MKPYEIVWSQYGDPAAFLVTLRDRMAAHRVSQNQLALRAGCNPSRVSLWFKWLRTDGAEGEMPRMENLVLLDEAMDQLVNDKEGRC